MMTRTKALRRIRQVQRELCSLGFIAQGIIVRVHKVCGNASCHCARKGDQRHGPYFVWSRLEKGKLARTSVTRDEAKGFLAAMRRYRKLKQLLRKWQELSGMAIRSKPT